MRRFFRRLRPDTRTDPVAVATSYVKHVYESHRLLSEVRGSVFDIGIASADAALSALTKRVALISDTLLLSHHWAGEYREVATYSVGNAVALVPDPDLPRDEYIRQSTGGDYLDALEGRKSVGVTCPDFAALGRWVLDAQPLLETGLTIYLPSYSTRTTKPSTKGAATDDVLIRDRDVVKDLVVKDRRVIDATGSHPVHSALVRPVLDIDLPFVDGVDLGEFGRITAQEFGSYTAFRDFLRLRFLDLDEALDAVQSQRELTKIGVTIADQVRASRAEMSKVATRRAVMASGAAVGTVAATLVAVHGPALQAAIAAVGATGGIWGVVQAIADNNVRRMRDATPWHYAWVLSNRARR